MLLALARYSGGRGSGMFLTIIVVVGIWLIFRLSAGSMDRDRIRRYIEARGGSVIDIRWDPFGPGWFGSGKARIYAVSYRDAHGVTRDVHCKTSMWSGVYFTEGD